MNRLIELQKEYEVANIEFINADKASNYAKWFELLLIAKEKGNEFESYNMTKKETKDHDETVEYMKFKAEWAKKHKIFNPPSFTSWKQYYRNS